jgi:hypothetical protein
VTRWPAAVEAEGVVAVAEVVAEAHEPAAAEALVREVAEALVLPEGLVPAAAVIRAARLPCRDRAAGVGRRFKLLAAVAPQWADFRRRTIAQAVDKWPDLEVVRRRGLVAGKSRGLVVEQHDRAALHDQALAVVPAARLLEADVHPEATSTTSLICPDLVVVAEHRAPVLGPAEVNWPVAVPRESS